MSSSDTFSRIFTGLVGFIIGLLAGELFQMVTTLFFPEMTSIIADAFAIEGPLKESQDNLIDTVRILIDIVFGVVGAFSTVRLMSIFGGRQA